MRIPTEVLKYPHYSIIVCGLYTRYIGSRFNPDSLCNWLPDFCIFLMLLLVTVTVIEFSTL
jgi:hypothetical protein